MWENQAVLNQICFSRELQPTLFSGPNNLKVSHYLRSAAIYYPGWDRNYAQRLLEDFAQTGRTFLVSTHIIEEAASVFENVIILDQGRILENCPTEELVDQFRYISGREDVVDQVCQGLEVLSTQQMGRHKTVAVRGGGVKLQNALQSDVDVSPMNLQNVFVALCGHGDGQ